MDTAQLLTSMRNGARLVALEAISASSLFDNVKLKHTPKSKRDISHTQLPGISSVKRSFQVSPDIRGKNSADVDESPSKKKRVDSGLPPLCI